MQPVVDWLKECKSRSSDSSLPLFLPMATPQAMWFTIALAFCVRQLRGENAASPSLTKLDAG